MVKASLLVPLAAVLLAGCGTAAGKSPAAKVETRAYAALGASETAGVGAQPETNGYAYRVARDLGATHFRDPAISGTTLHAAYHHELAAALAIHPELTTLFFGFNDLVQGVGLHAFQTELHTLTAALRSDGSQVLIIGMPDLSLLPAARNQFPGLSTIIHQWNGAMAGVARSTGAHFLDLTRYSAELAAHPEYVSPDGLHPSNAGHARLAAVVVATVRQDGLWR